MSTEPPTFAEQAVACQREADRAFAHSDQLFGRGHDQAAMRAVHRGRRLQAQADRYRELAAAETSGIKVANGEHGK